MANEAVTAGRSEEAPKTKVFISYSRQDMAFADRLEAALKERAFEPLIDRTEIYAFEDWWKRIQALIAQADTVIFVLSPDAVASEVCAKEVAYAASLNKRFAPVVFRRVDDKQVPEALARLNFIFFDDEALFADGVNQLCNALATDIGWIRKHTQYGEAARHWAAGGRPAGLLLRSPVLEDAERWIASRPPGAPAPIVETQLFIAESRRATTRRRNILTGSLAAGLILALGLAGLAYWQRGVAVAEQARAERNFNAAKSTIDSVVFDLAQGLRNVEGMQVETVRRILGRAEAAVGQLASRTGNDPEVRRSQSVMFSLFSDTYLKLGTTELAADYAQKSADIMRALLVTQPGNTEWQRSLSLALQRVGAALAAQGDRPSALAAYRESLDIMRALVAKDPSNAEWQNGHSESLNSVGDVLVAQGNLTDALAAYRESLDIMRAVAAKDPGNTEW
jgi:predicted negative regulator of RcsB-dependent stress response